MNRIPFSRKAQRGEGKIGCLIAFVVVGVFGAAAYKAVPVFVSNNNFKNAVQALSVTASTRQMDEIRKEVRAKAVEFGIPEATVPGAVELTKTGDNFQGSVTVRYNFSRKIDFYGVTTFDYVTQETVSYPYMDAR